MADLPFFDEGGAGAEDGAVEVEGSWEGGFERFDTIYSVRNLSMRVRAKGRVWVRNLLLQSIISLPKPPHPLLALHLPILID